MQHIDGKFHFVKPGLEKSIHRLITHKEDDSPQPAPVTVTAQMLRDDLIDKKKKDEDPEPAPRYWAGKA